MSGILRTARGERRLGLRVGTPLAHSTTKVIDLVSGETIDGVVNIEFPQYRSTQPYTAKVTIEIVDLEIEPYAIRMNDLMMRFPLRSTSPCSSPSSSQETPTVGTEAPAPAPASAPASASASASMMARKDPEYAAHVRLVTEEEVHEKIQAAIRDMTEEIHRLLSEACHCQQQHHETKEKEEKNAFHTTTHDRVLEHIMQLQRCLIQLRLSAQRAPSLSAVAHALLSSSKEHMSPSDSVFYAQKAFQEHLDFLSTGLWTCIDLLTHHEDEKEEEACRNRSRV